MHEYLRRLLLAHFEHQELTKPGLSRIEVQHDSWCGIYNGKECHCDLDITHVCADGVIHRILREGEIEKVTPS